MDKRSERKDQKVQKGGRKKWNLKKKEEGC